MVFKYLNAFMFEKNRARNAFRGRLQLRIFIVQVFVIKDYISKIVMSYVYRYLSDEILNHSRRIIK